ncbi:MAG: NAD(P)H-dependent oxidoreductase [Proteobacteria bacterium]|nr:NAD(P)H-dependent oxidoreductase [Pseudomonadota bacterium]MBI3497689.1 NAD(P)H-dependent oxidoreductase [Pseudomonadota bacterium]
MTTSSTSLKILGICGSLRAKSFNKMALLTASKLMPAGMTLETFDLAPIPLYNADIHAQGFPDSVQALRAKIKAADGLLFACPEYNYSISGVLKNAIDWASRPPEQPFAFKPYAILGASMGMGGTMRAQYHLRQVTIFLDAIPLNRPEVFIGTAQTKFDDAGNCTDDGTKKAIADMLTAFQSWILRVRS